MKLAAINIEIFPASQCSFESHVLLKKISSSFTQSSRWHKRTQTFCAAGEQVQRGWKTKWKERTKILQREINFAPQRDVDFLADGIPTSRHSYLPSLDVNCIILRASRGHGGRGREIPKMIPAKLLTTIIGKSIWMTAALLRCDIKADTDTAKGKKIKASKRRRYCMLLLPLSFCISVAHLMHNMWALFSCSPNGVYVLARSCQTSFSDLTLDLSLRNREIHFRLSRAATIQGFQPQWGKKYTRNWGLLHLKIISHLIL